jgi:hypothetical protein
MYDTKNFLRTTPRPSGQKVAVLSKEICTDLLQPHTNSNTKSHISIHHPLLSFLYQCNNKLVMVSKGVSTELHTLTIVSCMAGLSRYSLAFAAA